MTAERLIALERNGALHVYAVNGEGPREVAWLEVGALSDADAITVATALSDLRTAVNERQPAPAIHTGERAVTAKPVRGKQSGPRARVVAYVYEHPGEPAAAIARALGLQRKNVSNALNASKTLGRVTLSDGVWFPADSPPALPPPRDELDAAVLAAVRLQQAGGAAMSWLCATVDSPHSMVRGALYRLRDAGIVRLVGYKRGARWIANDGG